jgi:hypothetical protein
MVQHHTQTPVIGPDLSRALSGMGSSARPARMPAASSAANSAKGLRTRAITDRS